MSYLCDFVRMRWVIIIVLFFIGNPVLGQEDNKSKTKEQQAKLFKELQQIISVAREAGYSEEEIKEITIERDGESINVWNFVKSTKEVKSGKGFKTAKKQEKQKSYLTVWDAIESLEENEGSELKKLKNQISQDETP